MEWDVFRYLGRGILDGALGVLVHARSESELTPLLGAPQQVHLFGHVISNRSSMELSIAY